MVNTPKIVREIRAAFGESQQKFAQRIGATQAMVARWETNRQQPTADWMDKLRKFATDTGLEDQAAELEGVMERERVKPQVEVRTEEESEEVNAVLRMLRRSGEYKADLATLKKATERAKKDNAAVLARFQAAADLGSAMVRLRDRGEGPREIAEILGVDEEVVNSYLARRDLFKKVNELAVKHGVARRT